MSSASVARCCPPTDSRATSASREYWPVYAEAERLGCCLSVHGGNHQGLGIDHLDVWQFVHALGHPAGQMISLAGLVANAVFDRYPGLRMAFLEGGVELVPHVPRAVRLVVGQLPPARPRRPLPRVPTGKKVSEYLMAHIDAGRIFVGCEGDELGLGPAVRLLGSTPFLFSSDFPHEVTEETCREEIEELHEQPDLSAADAAAILYGNAERLYRFPEPATTVNRAGTEPARARE